MAKEKPAPTMEQFEEAIQELNLRGVRAALDAGLDPDAKTSAMNMTPLQSAMSDSGGKKIALLLLERGANPNVQDKYGMTPLMWAACYGDDALAEALIKAGADATAKLKPLKKGLLISEGLTPEQIAIEKGKKRTAQLIRDRSAGKDAAPESAFQRKVAELQQAAFPVIDFEGSEDPVEEALIGVDRPDAFVTLGATGSGSVFALWKRGQTLEAAPVAYLDSEGSPRCVIAKSLDEFLSILPYGSGLLYDLMNEPKKKVTAKALAAAAGAEEPVDEQPFLKWWKSTFDVAPTKNPAAIVAGAAKLSQEFERWLAT